VLDALKDALRHYQCEDQACFVEQFDAIFTLTLGVKPKYAILIDSFYKIQKHIRSKSSIRELLEVIDAIKTERANEMFFLQKAVSLVDVQGKNILIYDHSHSVQHALSTLKESGKSFSILIAGQDLKKTDDNISFAHYLGVPYKVVPAYMLSHLDKTIDVAFFGAVTLQEGTQFVMDPGSKSIIAHLHLEKKPMYVFLTTSKFSLWPIESHQKEIYVKTHRRKHHHLSEIEFDHVKFSHDRVGADLINYTVTEKGIFTPTQLLKEYQTLREKRAL